MGIPRGGGDTQTVSVVIKKLSFLHSQLVGMQKHPTHALMPTRAHLACAHSRPLAPFWLVPNESPGGISTTKYFQYIISH